MFFGIVYALPLAKDLKKITKRFSFSEIYKLILNTLYIEILFNLKFQKFSNNNNKFVDNEDVPWLALM